MTLFRFFRNKGKQEQTPNKQASGNTAITSSSQRRERESESDDLATLTQRIDAATDAVTEIQKAVANLLETFTIELSLNNIRLKDGVTQKDAARLASEINHIIGAENQVYDATGMSREFQRLRGEEDPSVGVYNLLQGLVLKTQAYVDMYEPLKPVLSEKSMPSPQATSSNVLIPATTTSTPNKQQEPQQKTSGNTEPKRESDDNNTVDTLIMTIGRLSSEKSLEEIIIKLTVIQTQLKSIDFDTGNLAVKSPFAQAKSRFELSCSLSLTLPAIMQELENTIAKSSAADRNRVHALITDINVLRKETMQGISAHKPTIKL